MKTVSKVFALLFAFTFSLWSQAAPTAVQPQPVKKTVTGKIISGGVLTGFKIRPGSPTLEMGDWNSSGTIEAPYEPDYAYSYLCQVQVSDSIQRIETTASGQRGYTLIAVAETHLDNQHSSLSLKDLDWYSKKFYSMQEVVDTDEGVNLKAAEGWAYLQIRPGDSSRAPVTLGVSLSQKVEPLVFSNSNRIQATRGNERIVAYTSLDIRRPSGPEFPALDLRVICKKEK